jgi:selenocysteine lyase/cysteine desulfurase
VASSRDDRLRLALHLYNTDDDVDTVLAALRARRHLLS